ncbi:hypothetical protein [Thiomicrorhabdus arctica]|uniref:hypothetical protein n=1 Tax=Thiomicrorhabdus arctica TaxID=131540 RepID=UPI000362C33E|nr:hypothetical protein [Thiomicrorhabdus arctica]
MSFLNCRGSEAKNKIVDSYNIKPIVYIRLLAGQKIDGCCGPITDKYYLFEAEHKETKEIENFSVGYDCGDQFLQLTGHAPISLFNPFQAENGQGGGGEGNNEAGTQIHPLNRELKNAIHLLCSAWGGYAPKGSMRKFLEYINNSPQRATNSFAVVSFNNIVGKDAKNRNLSQIISDIRADNPTLREFAFPHMEKVLAEENKPSNL